MPERTHGAEEKAKVARVGATLEWVGGTTPVEGHGDVDGYRFYFRARGAEWQFHVALTDELIFHDDVFYHEQEYGEWPAAGYMPLDEAGDFIVEAIALFRARGAQQ